jgi:8-oxo-dGTP pyrophosphatase MutT (NUDIX family)
MTRRSVGAPPSPMLASLSQRLRDHRPGLEPAVADGAPRAAVALVLRDGPSGPELLFIKRAERDDDPWSGHIALPGGRAEPSDDSLEATAVRETHEETGIDLARDGQVLGALDPLGPRSARVPVVVYPYVALLSVDVPLTLSDEVAAAFWVPLGTLVAPDAVTESVVRVRGADRTVRSYRHGDHVVWGMTERIVGQLLTIVAAPSFP